LKKIYVLLDPWSGGDLYFIPIGKGKPFHYLTRQVPESWNASNGIFQKTGRGQIGTIFF
jgi:hypothetical protein